MRAKAKRQGKSFKDVLPVGTVLYRFAKSPNVRLVREYIVDAEASDNIKDGFDAEYTTDKNNYCHYTNIGSTYFLSAADALRYIAKENNINVRITERTTQN